jgi:hypothetical protein
MSAELPSRAEIRLAAAESPWEGGVRELVRGFLALRDLFSYALPGAVFVAIGLWSRAPEASQLITEIRRTPAWAVMLLGLFASYLTGQFLLAAYYLPLILASWLGLTKLWERFFHRKPKDPIYRLSSDELRYRRLVPELFVELDRNRIIVDMRRSLALALVLGVIIFRWWPGHWWDGSFERLLLASGVVIWINVLKSPQWGNMIRAFTLQAAREVLGEASEAKSGSNEQVSRVDASVAATNRAGGSTIKDCD